MSGDGQDYRSHPAYEPFVTLTVKLFKGQVRSIQEQISEARHKVAEDYQKLFSAEWYQESHTRDRKSIARLVAAQLKALSKNPNVQDFRVEERSRELVVTTHSLSIIGVEPELVLGELLIVINFGGAYPGLKVMKADSSVRGSPAPCVNEDGELLNDNLKLALPGLLGRFQYNQLVSSVCQVLKRVPADFSSSQLQTWRDARERMA